MGSSIAPHVDDVWACEFAEASAGPGYLEKAHTLSNDGSGVVCGVSSNGRHDQHRKHGASNRFRPLQPSCLSDSLPGIACWLLGRNWVMLGRPA